MLPFIISWVLTWFAHVFTSVKTICRIWDYILSTGPHGIIYLTSGIILATKADLLSQCPELDVFQSLFSMHRSRCFTSRRQRRRKSILPGPFP